MRLIADIERIPLGDEIEKYVTDDRHRGGTFQPWKVKDDRMRDDDDVRRRPARLLASRFTNPKLELDEQANGDVIITRPDGQRVYVYYRAIEATIRKAE